MNFKNYLCDRRGNNYNQKYQIKSHKLCLYLDEIFLK